MSELKKLSSVYVDHCGCVSTLRTTDRKNRRSFEEKR